LRDSVRKKASVLIIFVVPTEAERSEA
jgi:hypothetical protein